MGRVDARREHLRPEAFRGTPPAAEFPTPLRGGVGGGVKEAVDVENLKSPPNQTQKISVIDGDLRYNKNLFVL